MNDPARKRVSETMYNAVVGELAAEKAATLGRAGRRLEAALADYRAAPPDDPDLPAMLDAASEALYFYVVQREACGLRDADEIFREFRVPPEVVRRMGLRGRRRPGGAPPAA